MIDSDWLDEDTSVTRNTETAIEVPASLRKRTKAILTVISGFNAGQVFSISAMETIVGRGREAAVRIEDGGVSREHSRFLLTLDGHVILEDLGSTNGTFVNSKRIERVEIRSGDHVQFGPNVSVSFSFLGETEEALARQLYESSTRDPLTRAFNRRYFNERITSEVAYATRHKTRLGLLLFDLDHFKRVNDTHGHLVGDEVLRQVAAQMQRMIRTEDVLARYGGEEFVILVRGIEPPNVAAFADRLRRGVEKLPIPYQDKVLQQTISLGVSNLSECDAEPTGEGLLLLADERLYRAKTAGRNRVCAV